MKRARGHGGNWVCTPKDFLDLGARPAVDQALSRLAGRGQLRRVGHGLYHLPRMSLLLKKVAPPSLDQIVKAIARRDGLRVMPAGLGDANGLGLTNAVLCRARYFTDGATRNIRVGNRVIEFRHAGPKLMQWHGRPGRAVVNALMWFGRSIATSPDNGFAERLRRQLPDRVKRDLMDGIALLPAAWMAKLVRQMQG